MSGYVSRDVPRTARPVVCTVRRIGGFRSPVYLDHAASLWYCNCMTQETINDRIQRQYDLMLDISSREVKAAILGCTVPLPIGEMVNISRARGMTSDRMVDYILNFEEKALLFYAFESGKPADAAKAEVDAIMLRRRAGKRV
jgi:hypothetical protein